MIAKNQNRETIPVQPGHGKMPDFRDLPLFSSAIAAPTAERSLTADQVCKKCGIPKSELQKYKVQVGGFLEFNNWVILRKGYRSWRVINA